MLRKKEGLREESGHLLVVHAAVDGTLGDLEAVYVNDRQDCTRLCGVDILVAVPGTEGG